MTRTVAVLLAAGAGTRLGLGPKALLSFRGTTLVAHAAAELLRGGCVEVIVVVGASAAQVRATPVPPGCRIVENPNWRQGMGTSFAAGIAAAVGEGDADGTRSAPILVALVDQPGMTFGLIQILLAAHRPGRITAAGYRSAYGAAGTGNLRRGNPVLFSAEHAVAAAALAKGDFGARVFLAAHPELVDLVDVSTYSDGADIDTPADLPLLE